MEATAKLWQVIVACIGTLIGVGTIVYNSGGKDKEAAIKIENMQYQINQDRENYRIDRKEDKEWKDRAMNILLDLKISMKDKQDRKQ